MHGLLPLLLLASTVLSDAPCGADRPIAEWDKPACADYELAVSLSESAARGDHSAISLLEMRYAQASTHAERLLIAEGLLGRAKDDREYWNEVARHAEVVVAHPIGAGHTTAWDALRIAMPDKRSRGLMLRALESNDEVLVYAGIMGLAMQKDESALPAIEKALRRFPDSRNLPAALSEFGDASAARQGS